MNRKRSLDLTAVVQAAATIADAEGLEQLTLAQVAYALNIRVPSLYNHVGGMPGLRRSLALAGARACVDAIRRATVGLSGEAAVLALARSYRSFALARPGLYTASIRAPGPDDQELSAAGAEILEVALAVLAPYQLEGEAAIHAVRGLRSIVHGFVSLELAGGFGMPLAVDESFEQLVRTFIAGLGRVSASPA